jgi:APA family basic amino acid/polyamine antiporter
VAIGAVFATTSVLLVFQLGQPRIFFSMARDGLLPKWAAAVHPRFRTPHVTTIVTGVVVGLLSGVANINEVVELTNIGTLFAFVLVCIGVTVLRLQEPERERPFRVPFGPFLLPMLGVVSCVFLMVHLPPASWWRFIGWLVLGMAVYFAFGYNHSAVGRALGRPEHASAMQRVAALGWLAAGVGLFVIPHAAGPGELLALAGDGHARTVTGLLLIGLGIAAAAGGSMGMSRSGGR